jgi:hypothetical protein
MTQRWTITPTILFQDIFTNSSTAHTHCRIDADGSSWSRQAFAAIKHYTDPSKSNQGTLNGNTSNEQQKEKTLGGGP